jgi:carboxylesterase type B
MPPRTPNTPPEGGGDASEEMNAGAPETQDALKARIAELEEELRRSGAAKLIAEEESARLSAQAQSSMLTTNVTERFSRIAEDGSDVYWYRIDLAPCGGTEIKINGIPYYHGSTYEFRTDLLRSIKEIVARTWDHENNIMGSNENAYRVAQDRILRGGERRH